MATDVVPQTDPKANYLAHRNAIDEAVRRVLESGWYILGPEVEAFEAEFAAFVGVRHAVGVASGTDALVLALLAADVGPGDAVVTVSHTAVATIAAVEQVGAIPVLVDVDASYGMDPRTLAAALENDPTGGRIKAVIPVHLYGQPVNLDAILDLAGEHLTIIEDCSQAHGATWRNRPVGGYGAMGTFSFYPTKNLGALGDGGAVVTDDPALAERLRALRQYGWRSRYVSDTPGQNSRLDELQAAILRVRLADLPSENRRRQAVARAYDAVVEDLGLQPPLRRADGTHVFHQYVLSVDGRDEIQAALRRLGVMTGVHYPVPVHQQPAYRGRVPLGPGGLPFTEAAAGRILSLPMYPQLEDAAVARVSAALREVL
ncbi:MAG TPA: DegT/DnrJ/EryC1/StrS family aminotransferase [Azospirillaceae bacterium]|nr:DegT/DnrJ/EryC1/StrS family aminotransferase [Azospirillaceae bacterium]